ncbi:hypothetical protein DSM25558_0181 [Agrobacterium sp. DSM 25558]|nr:hypothetical protein DSM25558_0181 [Agrobacterium sp. DSM 25558]
MATVRDVQRPGHHLALPNTNRRTSPEASCIVPSPAIDPLAERVMVTEPDWPSVQWTGNTTVICCQDGNLPEHVAPLSVTENVPSVCTADMFVVPVPRLPVESTY